MDLVPNSLKTRAQQAAEHCNWAEAEFLYRQLISTVEYLFGPDHLEAVMSSHALANVLEQQGKMDEALLWREKTSELLLKLGNKL